MPQWYCRTLGNSRFHYQWFCHSLEEGTFAIPHSRLDSLVQTQVCRLVSSTTALLHNSVRREGYRYRDSHSQRFLQMLALVLFGQTSHDFEGTSRNLRMLGADQLFQVSTMMFTNLAKCLDLDHSKSSNARCSCVVEQCASHQIGLLEW
jgi:hypothetical protein